MSKKKEIKEVYQETYTTKSFFTKYAKRYGIILLIAAPPTMIFSFLMTKYVEGYTSVVSFFVSLTLLLFACFIGLIIFTKKDDKAQEESTVEKERDPFAD